MRIDELPARVADKIIPEPMSGCWLWVGASTTFGYGHVRVGSRGVDRRVEPAHRYVLECFGIELVPELEVDHLCRNPSCVNPLHLEQVTKAENILRGVGVGAVNARRTHCKMGHEYNTASWPSKPGQKRVCRECNKEASRRYRERTAVS